jgi:hypothetical protein
MAKSKVDYNQYIEDHTLRCEASYRGGGIEIDITELFPRLAKQSDQLLLCAYQNYLGGGMLGAISSSQNFSIDHLNKTELTRLLEIKDQLKRYFHNLTNHSDDEWEDASYEDNQNRPTSAY